MSSAGAARPGSWRGPECPRGHAQRGCLASKDVVQAVWRPRSSAAVRSARPRSPKLAAHVSTSLVRPGSSPQIPGQRVTGSPARRLVRSQERVGDLLVVEQVQVQPAPADVEAGRTGCRARPVHHAGQGSAVPDRVARVIVAVAEHERTAGQRLPARRDRAGRRAAQRLKGCPGLTPLEQRWAARRRADAGAAWMRASAEPSWLAHADRSPGTRSAAPGRRDVRVHPRAETASTPSASSTGTSPSSPLSARRTRASRTAASSPGGNSRRMNSRSGPAVRTSHVLACAPPLSGRAAVTTAPGPASPAARIAASAETGRSRTPVRLALRLERKAHGAPPELAALAGQVQGSRQAKPLARRVAGS